MYNRNNQQVTTNSKFYIEVLRVFASFAVVILHVAAWRFYVTPVTSIEWQAMNFYDSLVRWCVPVFVMITGSLLLNKKQSIAEIAKKYIFRIVKVLIFWSIFYALITLDQSGGNIFLFIKSVLAGYHHLWYLYMLIGLYICLPILRLVAKDKRILCYFLILSGIFAVFVPQMVTMIGILAPTKAEFVRQLVARFNLHLIMGYSSYFLLGYYLDSLKLQKKNRQSGNLLSNHWMSYNDYIE